MTPRRRPSLGQWQLVAFAALGSAIAVSAVVRATESTAWRVVGIGAAVGAWLLVAAAALRSE